MCWCVQILLKSRIITLITPFYLQMRCQPQPPVTWCRPKSLINFHVSSRGLVNTENRDWGMELQLDCDLRSLHAIRVLKRLIVFLAQGVNYLVNVAFCCEIKYQDNFPEVWGSDEGSCDKSVFSSLAGNIWFSDSPRPERWRMCFESEQRNSIVQQYYKTHIRGE